MTELEYTSTHNASRQHIIGL